MDSADPLKDPPDFSMVLGGPLYQLYLRMHVLRAPLDLLARRLIVIPLTAWLPLLVLAVISGRAWGGVHVPFLYDIDLQVRFLVALPLLILAEWLVHTRFRTVVRQFVERNVVTSQERPRFDDIIESSQKLRNSMFIEVSLAIIVFTFGPILWRMRSAIHVSTWYADADGSAMRMTLPGIVYLHVALPLFQFMLLRWYFRLIIWYRFLWKVSRLNLNLLPTHPDGAGGLGFLAGSAHAMAPLLVAQSALLAGTIANHIFFEGATLMGFRIEILFYMLFLLLQALGPLILFAPMLAACQRAGNREYGVLGSRYVSEFHKKWILGQPPTEENLLGSADIQSLADLANSFSVIRSISLVPFTRATVIRLAAVTLIPLLPLTLTVIPLDQMIDHFLKALL